MEELVQKQQKSKTSILINKLIKNVLPLVLGFLILYFLFRDTNFTELWAILKDANFAILGFSLIFGLLGNTIRGYRWQLLIQPLGYKPRVSTLNFAIYGGYAVNFALPRAGEVWRCGMVAKEENIPFSKLFGTMILDRIFDTLTVLILSLGAFFFNMQFFITEIGKNTAALESITDIFKSPILYASIATITLVLYIIFTRFKDNVFVKKITDFLVSMAKDMKAISQMKQKNRLILYTIGIWGSYFLYFYTTFFAFGFTAHLGFTAGLIAFALSSISMAIPTNGGMGAWHVAVIASLMLYGVDASLASAFAFGVFTIQSLWVILCGLIGMMALSLRSKK